MANGVQFDDKNISTNAERGIDNGPLYDPANFFEYNDVGTDEKIISGKHNTWIVFGRDRPGDVDSGYGSTGDSKCGSIDIVSGRLSVLDARTLIDEKGQKKKANPSPFLDAARVYISQKTDVDVNFGIVGGVDGVSKARSAVVLKADDVRLISRNSMKLVTKTDPNLSIVVNGQPVRAISNVGIQLIANNDDTDMQPLPKGDNLRDALKDILAQIRSVNNVLEDFVQRQSRINLDIANHYHLSPFGAAPTSPSATLLGNVIPENIQLFTRVQLNIKKNIVNLVSLDSKFFISSAKRYINSSYNYTN